MSPRRRCWALGRDWSGAVWFAIRRFAHLQIGLVAIAVGYMIGKAVRKGSGGRGGRGYQVLAVVLTYCCIAANYMPDVLEALMDSAHNSTAPAELIVFAFGYSLALPFLSGAQNFIGLLIIGFALWQAWKLTARRRLPITGPYFIAQPDSFSGCAGRSGIRGFGGHHLMTQLAEMMACAQCGAQLAPSLLACPSCGRLVHADTLSSLSQTAKEAEASGAIPDALAAWRTMLDLLPTGSKQHQAITAKITELGRDIPFDVVPASKPADGKSPASKAAAGLGAIGLMLWKLKALLLGLTKGTTLLSMLLSLGVYWTIWGWKFALGLVLSIYVHEMGHVIALRRYGFKASAPTFIPGLGALIRLRQQVVNPDEDAEIGLAGPIYGLGAAVVALGLWYSTKLPIFAAIAGVGAWINLFNLLPVGTLDGGRGFHAMSRVQKFLAAATVAGAWYYTSDGLLIVLALLCVGRAFADRSVSKGNWKAAITYCGLVVALAAISMVRSLAVTR